MAVFNEECREQGVEGVDRIMVKVIKAIISFTINIWYCVLYSRCSQFFGGTKSQRIRKKCAHLLAQVTDLKTDRHVPTQHGKDQINGTPDDNIIIWDITAWIRNTRVLYR